MDFIRQNLILFLIRSNLFFWESLRLLCSLLLFQSQKVYFSKLGVWNYCVEFLYFFIPISYLLQGLQTGRLDGLFGWFKWCVGIIWLSRLDLLCFRLWHGFLQFMRLRGSPTAPTNFPQCFWHLDPWLSLFFWGQNHSVHNVYQPKIFLLPIYRDQQGPSVRALKALEGAVSASNVLPNIPRFLSFSGCSCPSAWPGAWERLLQQVLNVRDLYHHVLCVLPWRDQRASWCLWRQQQLRQLTE